ncbi:hypothetical protein RYH73_18290 [Olivibacter sp. CPCC 100613]|uniref:hypothetical protein n=1 Tax=Olivibacter sp. CPCC 100613 TaxID=3079931 RepID=UPI002FFD1B2F
MNQKIAYIVIKKSDGIYLRPADDVDQSYLYGGELNLTPGDRVTSDQVTKVLQAELNAKWINVDGFHPLLSPSLPYQTRYIFLDKQKVSSEEHSNPWIALNKQIPDEMQECLFTKFEYTEHTQTPGPIIHGIHLKNGLFRPLHVKATHLFKPTHWMSIP